MPKRYHKTYVVPHGRGWRYKRRVPLKLQVVIGQSRWVVHLKGTNSYAEAVRAAEPLIRTHDALIGRLEALPCADLQAVATKGGLQEVQIAADDRGAVFVEALAVHTDVDPLDDEEQQALQALEIVRARKAAKAMREAAVGARALLARVEGREPEGVANLIPVWVARNRPRSTSKMERHVRRFVDVNGDMPARSVTRSHVAAFRDALERDPRLGRRTAAQHLASLHALFQAAVSADVLPVNPAAGIRISKSSGGFAEEGGRGRQTFTAEHARAILEAAKNEHPDMQWMLRLLAYTGARSGELAQLRTDDVTMIEGVLVLRIHDKYGPLKNRFSVRDIPIPPACIGIVDYAATVKGPWLFASFEAWGTRSRGVTFQHRAGLWLRRTLQTKGTGLALHSFRHRWKTVAEENDVPEPVRKAIMGHSGGSGVHAGYGERVSLRKRADWMAKIDPLA
jgi:integrase